MFLLKKPHIKAIIFCMPLIFVIFLFFPINAFAANRDFNVGDVQTAGASWLEYRICSPRISTADINSIISHTSTVGTGHMWAPNDQFSSGEDANNCAGIARGIIFPSFQSAQLTLWAGVEVAQQGEDFYIIITSPNSASPIATGYFPDDGRDGNVPFTMNLPAMTAGSYDIWVTPGPQLSGSVHLSDAGPFRLTLPQPTTGTILGRIFRDDNGNGQWDSGELFIRDPSGPICNNEFVIGGFQVNGIGPVSGSTVINKCNPDPFYSGAVPPGTYSISLTTPSDYIVTNTNPQIANVTSGGYSHIWFGVKKNQAPPPPQLPTVHITATPSTIQQGDNSLLSWTSQNATTCTASGGWSGAKTLNGTETVTPQYSTTYFITCSNQTGQVADNVTVIVNPKQVTLPTVHITASPGTVNQGNQSILNWTSQNATTCTASGGWSGGKNLSGTESVTPNYTTIYSIYCSNSFGSANDSVTIFTQIQTPQQQLPTVYLIANPTSIYSGNYSTLTWGSSNANYCYASGGWSGNQNLSGSQTVAPQNTTNYTISCSNNYGTAQDSKTVQVLYNNNYITPPTVTKLAINRTLNQNVFSNSIEAQGLDVLEFEIHIRNNSSNLMTLTVRDQLPQELYYTGGSTTVNGSTASDGITAGGLSLYSMYSGEERTIRFRAVVFSGTSQGIIINQATVTDSSSNTQTGSATITIRNRGRVLGIANIPTGPEGDPVLWVLLFGLIGSIGLHFVMLKKKAVAGKFTSVISKTVSLFDRETTELKTQQKLEAELARIRSEEKNPDTSINGY